MDAKVHLQLENRFEDIAPVLDRIDLLLQQEGADAQVSFRIRLALDELITNSVMYGFPAGGKHEIAISVAIGNDQVAVELSDDGVPFDPLNAGGAPVLAGAAEERPVGGLGLHFVRELIPELSYRRAAGRNLLHLRSPLRL